MSHRLPGGGLTTHMADYPNLPQKRTRPVPAIEDSALCYDDLATHYDKRFTEGRAIVPVTALARVMDLLGGECRTLDLGCGTGHSLLPPSRQGAEPLFRVGLDLSQEMLR